MTSSVICHVSWTTIGGITGKQLLWSHAEDTDQEAIKRLSARLCNGSLATRISEGQLQNP